MTDFIGGLINVFVEIFITATGRGLLKLFGARRPYEIASLFTGMAFWALIATLVCAAVLR